MYLSFRFRSESNAAIVYYMICNLIPYLGPDCSSDIIFMFHQILGTLCQGSALPRWFQRAGPGAGHIPDNFDKDQKDYQMKLSAILIKWYRAWRTFKLMFMQIEVRGIGMFRVHGSGGGRRRAFWYHVMMWEVEGCLRKYWWWKGMRVLETISGGASWWHLLNLNSW